MIHVPGYRPAFGALEEAEGSGTERRQFVELERGWGAEIWLRDASGAGQRTELDTWALMARVHQAPPVSGLAVLADGQRAGVSDELGRVRLALDEQPSKIVVAGSEWVVLDSDSFRDGALVDTEAGEPRSVVLWLAPAR